MEAINYSDTQQNVANVNILMVLGEPSIIFHKRDCILSHFSRMCTTPTTLLPPPAANHPFLWNSTNRHTHTNTPRGRHVHVLLDIHIVLCGRRGRCFPYLHFPQDNYRRFTCTIGGD